MAYGGGHDLSQMGFIAGKGSGDKGSTGSNGNQQRIKRGPHIAGSGFMGQIAGIRGRRGLALGQTINLVVMDKMGDINIAADIVEKVIPPFPVRIAIAGIDNHRQVIVGNFDRRRGWQRAAMETAEAVGGEILIGFGGLANPSDQDDLMRRCFQLV